jgi:type IV secretory pathway TrbD component
MLDQHKVHESLLRPPLLFGVERGLFFICAGGAAPIFSFGGITLRTGLALLIYGVVAYVTATRITAMDSGFLDLCVASLRYKDHYSPHPTPNLPGRPPGRPSFKA